MRRDASGWQVRLDDAMRARYGASGDWPNKTLADFARELAARDPQRVTHVFGGECCTVSALLNEAEALAAALRARGLAAGDVVSFQLPNWREAVVIDLATTMLGLVVAPIVPIYRDAEVAFMLGDAGVKAAFFPAEYRGFDYAAMMRRLAPQLPQLRLPVTVRGGEEGAGFAGYEALVAENLRLDDPPTVDPDAVKMILYTSGTTGRPKGVLHSHNTGPLRLRRAFEQWSRGSNQPGLDNVLLMASPVTHVTGQSGMEIPFCSDTRTVFMERWNADEALEIIEREQVTASVGATPFLHELLGAAERAGQRLPSLQVFACGGAEVPPALITRAYSVLENCRAFRVYGSSEVPLTTLGFFGEGEMDLAATTDGRVADYEVRIVDDGGRVLPPGEEGEICVRGPAMLLAYADPAATAESFDADGFFATGDLGRLTAQGAIVVTGRKKDLINRGGEKVSAKEVEDILHRMPDIREAAVVSMPHARLGETLCAYVIAEPGAVPDLDGVLAFVAAAGVARQKYPEKLVVVDDFPRTASGKIRKDRLRADIRARLGAAATPA
ncbi:AMP-binding protein [Thauera linaloolentis]|uniref:AMP-dependent synthetase/ligase n=1 Tax=Thauera linaloolentis (strain DSM 12138 / JCM 21573 / CCUG 41526 / CIP 105981 / IAM 15112 / NBRC 102519 / 47Lol) TaxID=1123367 RepID=N6YSC1_THAL4|nr:AMP-binding protein [Thauera linaloolentis]ENO85098.1 AMP-dependent synthetase/ligase [Thauera linaloolentis 47Lol = DSM 12138]MCM8566716.1 AMP-binding protein [Thauera linaloolentis]